MNAIASCQLQTVSVAVVVVKDCSGAGAGYARNRGLEVVETPLTVFLDADDTIAPTFIERCLSVFNGRCYIYSDHWQGDKLVHAPNCAWVNKTWHPITTLLPTEWAREVGGFDESLPAAEDSDFYLKLVTNGHGGRRLPEALFHYGDGGQRSKAFVGTPRYDQIMQLFSERYGGKPVACGECGDSPNIDLPPVGEPQPGDELAIATWAGNRQERGRATGRLYPRSGNGKQVYVHHTDIDASPNLWRRVAETTMLPIAQPRFNGSIPAEANVRVITPTPAGVFPQMLEYVPLDGANGVAKALNDFQMANFPPPPPPTPQPVEPVAVTPDVAKVTRLYREGKASFDDVLAVAREQLEAASKDINERIKGLAVNG